MTLPTLQLVGFGIEFGLNLVICWVSIFVILKLLCRRTYHLNLRITVINVYIVMPLVAISRSLWLIQRISENTWLSPNGDLAIEHFVNAGLLSLWYMQLPAMVERICATVYYKTYLQWKCWGTLFLICCCWIWVVVTGMKLLIIPGTASIILVATSTFLGIPVYTYLFYVNYRRFHNGRGSQNLRVRYQVFENIQSLMPLFWTVGLEMVYNIGSVACTVIRVDYISDQTAAGFDVFDGIKNMIREILCVLYCFPFLIYSNQRRQSRFLNKVSLEMKNENILYFKQLHDQCVTFLAMGLASLPLGHDMPAWRLVGFIEEFILNALMTAGCVYVIIKVSHRHSYNLNLRISVINMYVVIIICAITRTILLIHILTQETLLSPSAYLVVFTFYTGSLSALWYMQIPVIIERVCATAFYKKYRYWKCYSTVFCVFITWVWNIICILGIVRIPSIVTLILLAVANIGSIIIYTILIKVNINRYRNGCAIQNLRERHQLFENMKSLYPIVWTVAIEMLYNLKSVIVVAVVIIIIAPSQNTKQHEVEDGISSILREILLLLYCIPFLVFSEQRQKTRFLSQVKTENQNESKLYFQQLQRQWAAV